MKLPSELAKPQSRTKVCVTKGRMQSETEGANLFGITNAKTELIIRQAQGESVWLKSKQKLIYLN
jgi:hypothetical protein